MIYKKTITNFIARLSQLVELGASKSDFTKSNKLPKRLKTPKSHFETFVKMLSKKLND